MQRPDITQIAVERQVNAMGCEVYEVGILDPNFQDRKTGDVSERMYLRRWQKETLLRPATVAHLKLRNMKGCHIYIRPAGEHGLCLVDDLSPASVQKMKADGFEPAVVVMTSPGNLQVWLKHGEVLPARVSTMAARIVAQRFNGDLASSDWRHFGRLAGFTNRKSRHQREDGSFPYVLIPEHSGQSYCVRDQLLREADSRVHELERVGLEARETCKLRPVRNGALKDISVFRNDPRYKGDNTRADFAYSLYAAARGVAAGTIAQHIAGRDLSHKGVPRRQDEYVDRTVVKAIALAGKSRDVA